MRNLMKLTRNKGSKENKTKKPSKVITGAIAITLASATLLGWCTSTVNTTTPRSYEQIYNDMVLESVSILADNFGVVVPDEKLADYTTNMNFYYNNGNTLLSNQEVLKAIMPEKVLKERYLESAKISEIQDRIIDLMEVDEKQVEEEIKKNEDKLINVSKMSDREKRRAIIYLIKYDEIQELMEKYRQSALNEAIIKRAGDKLKETPKYTKLEELNQIYLVSDYKTKIEEFKKEDSNYVKGSILAEEVRKAQETQVQDNKPSDTDKQTDNPDKQIDNPDNKPSGTEQKADSTK